MALLAPYPNPANGRCALRFHCACETDAELLIADATGARVRRIGTGRYTPGMHRLHWDGRDDRGRRLPSGTYFVRLRTATGVRQQRRVIVVR